MDTPLSVYHSSSNIQKNNVKPLNPLHDYIIEPADQSNQEDQLTDLAISSEPKDVQPVGEVNRPNLNRASRAEDIAEGNSSIVERQRAFYKDHTYARQHKRVRQKQHLNEQQRQRQRDRKKAQQRDRKRELRRDPIYAELEREHKRQRIQNDPDFAERQRAHRRRVHKKSRLRRALKDSQKGVP
ncbi:hypothetical protein [Endozoicomonas sp. GU-1]|nr:hypothetical protein [Endozoicomonas sp. GU-1]WBA83715.1 hypothetical protein O2T12_11660 [Endozoicomonas sp. GU-1]